MISIAVIIPVSGWLGDRYGTKRIFLLALALFSVASALCGLSITLPMLVGCRILQGMAGGALTPVGTTILYRTFPPAERVQVSRLLIFLVGVGMGFSFLSAQTATYATISPRATGQASALANTLRQIGSALGIALVGSALGIVGATRANATGSNLTAYHVAFLAAALLEGIAVVFALTIHDRDAAATMQPQSRHEEEGERSELSPAVEVE